MVMPVVASVQEKGTTAEKGSISSDQYDQDVQHTLRTDDNIQNVWLEESLAWADAQYGENDLIPEGSNISPRDAIRKGPLRHLWGPPAPAVTARPNLESVDQMAFSEDTEAAMAKRLDDRRALRKVTAFGAFSLITTDILGPFNTGYAYSTVGFVPGVLLYVFMGIAAAWAGLILNSLYLRIDSDRYPVKNYGQLMGRIITPRIRFLVDILMIVQFIVTCGVLLLSNAQSLTQMIAGPSGNGHLCFVVCIIIFLIINLLLSPIRTLRGIGIPARAAVFLNVALIFMTIAFIATSPPNFAAAEAAYGIGPGPVVAVPFVQAALESKINGFMNMVYAYAGAQVFIDFMSEMRRPWDFWKSMACAQTLIATLYVVFGAVTYAIQGQYTQSLAYYGVSKYSEQTVGNLIAVITGVTAALLYGNIAQKLCYTTVVERWFKGPALMSSKGWICWMGVNLVFWPLAFIVGTAIPQIQTISGVIAAVAFVQFAYSFPFLMRWAFDIQVQAMQADPAFTPGTVPQRIDSWTSLSRWRRALFTGTVRQQLMNWVHLALLLASLTTAALGMYGSGLSVKETFATSVATSFGCAANV